MSVTTIEWTKRPGTVGETWNPTTGCNKVDRGCKHCYAEVMHRRLQAMGQEKYKADFLDGAVAHPDTLKIPLAWAKPRTVFVDSMSDLFHKDVPFDFIGQVFEVMSQTPQHTYLILTKRPDRAVDFWAWRDLNRAHFLLGNRGMIGTENWKCPANIWMGTSVNDQNSTKRILELLKLRGCLRFLSYEPATGPVDLRRIIVSESGLDEDGKERRVVVLDALDGIAMDCIYERDKKVWSGVLDRDVPRLHWIIMGGESGHGAEPMHPAWVRKVRDDCKATGTPFFFKQWGVWSPITFYKENQEVMIKFNLGKDEFLFPDPAQNMKKVGKGIAGHTLDGEVWQQFPHA
jgi:protein gp37